MDTGRREPAQLEPIEDIISHILANGRFGRAALVAQLWSQWTAIAGEDIASHSFPEKVSGRKLYVKVDSPIWRQQLDLIKDEMKEKINQDFQDFEIQKIIFR
jgi:predicted nucleic acid-binding Zn ribbon protein